MNTVLVVTSDSALRDRLQRSLAGFSVFEATSDVDAVKTLRLVDVDLVLRETAGPSGALSTFVAGVRGIAPTALIIAIGLAGEEESLADFTVPDGFTARELDAVLHHALDKQRLVREITALRESSSPVPSVAGTGNTTSWDGPALARVLKAFSRVFAAGFDLRRVLETFLEAIGDVVRPTRMAVLIPDADGREFRIVAHRALAPQIVQSIRLGATEGLARWLAAQGRPAALGDLRDADIVRELKLLQGVVAIPLLAHGELVAILVLGQPVFGAGYERTEIETLFDLATQLATVIRDITLHQHLQREKEFSERILSHMSSGVITIGRDHRVGTMNRRAEEILGLSAHAVVSQDLRVLPSPLGDLLFDTLSSGRAQPRTEIQLALRRLWIEVTTYVIRDEEGVPLGAVLVFEDLTAQKELAAQRREADQFQLLTRVVARIADEIKNPLVSINAFMELIGERYEDPSFRHQFSSVVGRDVRRLIQIFDKLATLVSEGDYKRDIVDLRAMVEECLVELGAQALPSASGEARLLSFADESTQKHVTATLSHEGPSLLVTGDHSMLKKAIAYLAWYLLRKTPGPEAKIAVSISRLAGEDRARLTVASRTAEVRPEELQGIFDPIQVVQESLLDVGPCVSQRIIEGQGGRLDVKQGRNEVSFTATLPAAPQL